MQKKCIILVVFFTLFNTAFSQSKSTDTVFKRNFIGSSGFMLANLFPDPPSFYQLNYGYWLTRKDVLSVEAKTWRYNHPLGIPYGPSYEAAAEAYPGSVRGFGLGIAYQHYWWKGAYSAVHAAAFKQKYLNPDKIKIGNGFQLFTVLRFGYHIRLLKDRFFIEPSVAFTYWPVNTNLPPSFKIMEKKWPNYFCFEPGLHFGYKF